MKKILIYSLLVLNLFFVRFSADEYNTDGNYQITLTCVNAPSYSVKIPRSVNVTNENTTLTFYVKGDIYADQSLRIVFDSSTTLSYNGNSVPVIISQAKNTWSCNELSDSYSSSGINISHSKLNAGTWTGHLNVAISLQGAN